MNKRHEYIEMKVAAKLPKQRGEKRGGGGGISSSNGGSGARKPPNI